MTHELPTDRAAAAPGCGGTHCISRRGSRRGEGVRRVARGGRARAGRRAGEGRYAAHFARQRYYGVDLGVGDAAWDYRRLDAVADLAALPFAAGCFAAAVSVVTLEHVREPARVVAEMARTLKPGGGCSWLPRRSGKCTRRRHDYYRFTRYGLRSLLEARGSWTYTCSPWAVFPAAGAPAAERVAVLPRIWLVPAALLLVPPALVLPALDSLDRDRNFTLGYICKAKMR